MILNTMINRKKTSKALCITGSGLLLIMGIFHGSGINYLNNMVQTSNSPELIKNIFPVLFIFPTIQLVGLAIFGVIASNMKRQANKILIPLSIFVLIDAILAFYLSATIPGLVLLVPFFIFILVAYWNKKEITTNN